MTTAAVVFDPAIITDKVTYNTVVTVIQDNESVFVSSGIIIAKNYGDLLRKVKTKVQKFIGSTDNIAVAAYLMKRL